LALGLLVFGGASGADCQVLGAKPEVYGYFQNTLAYFNNSREHPADYTSFSVQQLNLMLKEELTPQWTAFINLEFVNSYSSGQMLGELNLEEAWVKFRINQRKSLKLGLHTPEFNRMNAIKTKMPLLPYIIRPLVYETSVQEGFPSNEYVPEHAYISLYGTAPLGSFTVDHSIYIGNSPNLSTNLGGVQAQGQSAVDTSMSFLFGGRVGVRSRTVHAGVSGSVDFVDYPAEVGTYIRDKSADLTEIPRYRLGSDLRFSTGPVTFEGELIRVYYKDDIREIMIDKEFYYGTVLLAVSDRLTVFGGYWYTGQNMTGPFDNGFGFELVNFSAHQEIPNVGAAYNINDRVVGKIHFGKVDEDADDDRYDAGLAEFMYYGLAASVMF
jgi:hypothetical protein